MFKHSEEIAITLEATLVLRPFYVAVMRPRFAND
jgi:hypothetical protein